MRLSGLFLALLAALGPGAPTPARAGSRPEPRARALPPPSGGPGSWDSPRPQVRPHGDLRGSPGKRLPLCEKARINRECAARARMGRLVVTRDDRVEPDYPKPWASRQVRKWMARHSA